MKKIALSIMALAMAAVTFTSCEDVPAPYDYPGTGGGGSTTEGVYLNQSFAKDLGDFKSFGTNDNIAWTIDYSSACITGYKDFNGDGTKSNEAGVTYLVSPEIDLTKASKAYIEMNHAMKYERADVNANNTLLISKDYTDDPTKATWTPIAYPTTGLNDASTKEFVFVTSKANIPAEFIGQKVRIAFRHTCTDKQSSTWEIKTLSVKEGEVENGGGEVTPTPGEGTGEGTEASPYNVTKALAIIASGSASENDVYVSGIVSTVSEIETSNFGNATYNISVDGTTNSELIIFRGYYLGGVKFTATDQLKVGDKVVVCGKLIKFYEKSEMAQGNKLISLNGKKAEEGGGEEKPGGGEVTPPAPTGDNLLANGNCETWDGTTPVNWKTTSKAGNASLKQSTDAHGGSYSISVGFNASQNKRLGYKEITLKAGSYKFSFYAKSTTADASQCRPGYVVVTDGVADKTYNYREAYEPLNNSTWTLVSYEFTLTETKTICLVVMNPKTTAYATAQDILVDDASLVTSNGGFAE